MPELRRRRRRSYRPAVRTAAAATPSLKVSVPRTLGGAPWPQPRPRPAGVPILHLGFIVASIPVGLDKFFEVLVDWDRYLALVATDVLPVSAHSVMLAVGVVEIAAGGSWSPCGPRTRLRRRRLAVGHHRQPADPRRLLRHRPARLRALARRPCPGPAGRGVPRRRRRARVRHHLPAAAVTASPTAASPGRPPPRTGRPGGGRGRRSSAPRRLGADPAAEGLADTPPAGSRPPTPSCSPRCRSPPPPSPTTRATTSWWWPARSPFHSLCQHHLLPFHGVAHVGYLPASESSACPSWPVVELFARHLQTQERLTGQGRLAPAAPGAARGRGGGGCRAPVHDRPRGPVPGRAHRHLGPARPGSRTTPGPAASSSPWPRR